MEILLLFILGGLVIYSNVSANARHESINSKLRELQKAIDQLKNSAPIQRPSDAPDDRIVSKPIEPTVQKAEIPIPDSAPETLTAAESIPVKEPVLAGAHVRISTKSAAFEAAEAIPTPRPIPIPPAKSWWEKFKDDNPDLEKFIGENLINKIGVLILVLGISYFVKYAIDKDWINEPARVGIGILCGALVMGFAHRLRKNYAAFSSAKFLRLPQN